MLLPHQHVTCLCVVVIQESEEWSEVVAGLPPVIRGRLVSAVLHRSCRAIMNQLSKGDTRSAAALAAELLSVAEPAAAIAV